jgi:hypothetical protein
MPSASYSVSFIFTTVYRSLGTVKLAPAQIVFYPFKAEKRAILALHSDINIT